MLQHGTALRFPIYDANGILLLVQGTLINERIRRLLEARGISLELDVSLKLSKGGEVGLEIPVDKPFLNVGRRPDCDVQLASHVVSGHHCRIVKSRFSLLLRDLGSANGTFLNGCRVEDVVELRNDDRIRIGHFTFEVQILAALAADSHEGSTALKAWLLEEDSSSRKPVSQYARTEPDIGLGNDRSPMK